MALSRCVEISPSKAAFCFRYSTCSDEGDVAFFDANRDEDGLSVPACISSVISEGAFICGLPDDIGASCCSLAEGAEFLDVPSGIGVFERLEGLRKDGMPVYMKLSQWIKC